jgi:hypothetical protein
MKNLAFLATLLTTTAFAEGPIYVTGAGAGGGPHVIVSRQADDSTVSSFFAYPAGVNSGVRVATCRLGTNQYVFTVPGPTSTGDLRAFTASGTQVAQAYVYPGSVRQVSLSLVEICTEPAKYL